MIAPLRYRTFRLLFAGQAVSNLGDWLSYVALIVLIAYEWGHGASALAALAVAIAIPYLFIAPIAGVYADRWPKRTVMVGSDLARAVLVLGLVFVPNVYVLLTLVFLMTAFATLFNPAEQAMIRSTVPDEELLAANSLSQLALQGAKVVGPAIGGLILIVTTPRVAFAIDSATFLLSALILSRLPRLEPREGDEDGSDLEGAAAGFWSELTAGLSHIVRSRALVFALGSFTAAVFLVFMFDTLSPLALRELGVGSALLGAAIAAVGLGAVAGTIVVGHFGARANPFAILGAGMAVAGALVAVLGIAVSADLDPPPQTWLPVALGIGFAAAAVLIPFPTILQLETPPELMGRVSASAGSLPGVVALIAPLLGAALAEWQGVGLVLALSGGGLVVLGLTVFVKRPPLGAGVAGQALPVHGDERAPLVISAEPDVVGYVLARKKTGPYMPEMPLIPERKEDV